MSCQPCGCDLEASSVCLEHQIDNIKTSILDELSRYLSPNNENITRGLIIESIRDLAQAMISYRDHCTTLETKIGLMEQENAGSSIPK